MESFAERYCQLNPDIFTNSDTCYVLSFAIIMLNTSLHNPSVRDKPSVDQFVSMNRGINDGGDLPRELLVSLYESIKTEPFKVRCAVSMWVVLETWYIDSLKSFSFSEPKLDFMCCYRFRKMMVMIWCTPSLIPIVRAGCGNREEDIKAGSDGGLYWMITAFTISSSQQIRYK